MARLDDLIRFYDILADLERRLGGTRTLGDCSLRTKWPARGVYFFFEPGETRSDSGRGPRVVRVGTHALTSQSRTSLWNRLSQHRGITKDGSGNHRGSIFRLIVGAAIKRKIGDEEPRSWGLGSDPGKAAAKLVMTREQVKTAEKTLERRVSEHIRSMPFLWLAVEDAPGPGSARGVIERNSIGLLSNWGKPALDPPSTVWLGRFSDRERVRNSGLWNNNHVNEGYRPEYLQVLAEHVQRM